jgi:hypothetical protein
VLEPFLKAIKILLPDSRTFSLVKNAHLALRRTYATYYPSNALIHVVRFAGTIIHNRGVQ